MLSSLPQRKRHRLTYWDYSRPAHYFITICCEARACLFGEVQNDQVQLSQFGQIAQQCLLDSIALRSELTLDTSLVMPNHIHLIVVLAGRETGTLNYVREERIREPRSISSFAGGYKGSVTTRINTVRRCPGRPVFQRGFHDHIIRTEAALFAIRQYIADNPRKWLLDRLHPNAVPDVADEIDDILDSDARWPV